MQVNRIALEGFRNFTAEIIDFAPGTNVIYGDNAQGKTNLLEAVYMLSGGKSFRTRTDRELISFDKAWSKITADITSGRREQTIYIAIEQGKPKKITVNSVKKNACELSESFNTVLFCPGDLNLIKEGAAVRRRLMDNAISQLRPQYGEYLSSFNRYFDHKTRILKDGKDRPSLYGTLDDFTDGMCRYSAHLIRYRYSYVQRLKEKAKIIHRDFTEGQEELDLVYTTVSSVTDPTAPVRDIYYELCEHAERHRAAEIAACQCLTGAHKDDIEILINGKNARSFASQGQTRTAALCLKLAEREIFPEETGEMPVLLLDDVLSELDAKRQDFVLNRIGEGQTIITCCEDNDISGKTGGRIIGVRKGRII